MGVRLALTEVESRVASTVDMDEGTVGGLQILKRRETALVFEGSGKNGELRSGIHQILSTIPLVLDIVAFSGVEMVD